MLIVGLAFLIFASRAHRFPIKHERLLRRSNKQGFGSLPFRHVLTEHHRTKSHEAQPQQVTNRALASVLLASASQNGKYVGPSIPLVSHAKNSLQSSPLHGRHLDLSMQSTQSQLEEFDAESLTVHVPTEEQGLPLSFMPTRQAAEIVTKQGCVTLRGVMDTKIINKLQDLVMARLEACSAAIEKKGINVQQDGFAFKEICHRATKRYDIILTEDNLKEVLSDKEMNKFRGTLEPLCKQVLGDSMKVLYMGAVVSRPGAVIQDPHMDNPHLFYDTIADNHPQLPPHVLTAFIPLIDVSMAHGPTEFWPASNQYGANDNLHPLKYGDHLPSVTFTYKMGDALIFDTRVVHRGCENKEQVRPYFYINFCREWVGDDRNFPEESLGIDKQESKGFGGAAFGGGQAKTSKTKTKAKTKKKR